MINRRVTCTLVILQAVFFNNKAQTQKVVNEQTSQKTSKYEHFRLAHSSVDSECENKYVPTHPSSGDRAKPRFIDLTANTSEIGSEMEALAPKYSILNLLSDDDEKEEEEEENSKDEDYKEIEGEKEEEEDDGEEVEEEDEEEEDGINFFGEESESSSEKPEDNNDDGALKQYHRPGIRMHDFVFPLLVAYKLKFFMVIPLLLGAIVLLIGTTGVAGFFFALFAAALGIHVKYHEPH